jgi:hypothetical protein
MKVSELIKVLEKCDKDCEVYFEETQTHKEDGIEVGVMSVVNSVYECGARENDSISWNKIRVVLSTEEGEI